MKVFSSTFDSWRQRRHVRREMKHISVETLRANEMHPNDDMLRCKTIHIETHIWCNTDYYFV